MPREDAIKVEGIVIEALPNKLFRIALANGHQILGHLNGKMRPDFFRISVGDKVMVEMSPYDLSKGRIVVGEK
ncbi:MAG: translation initiation factor IF-1 [Verrucomicrobiota bacterium]|nr:translation initiation factor IF-1 [Verrucomicrobiota bacterium]